jgi:signal transduction histidine kinase
LLLLESPLNVVYQDVTALKEAEQLKDEFIGIAAHELRTPVAVLKGAEIDHWWHGQSNWLSWASWI